jgi:hypothetical protein
MKEKRYKSSRQNRTVCLPFDQESYDETVRDASLFRLFVDEMIICYPELFPSDIIEGYQMKDRYDSKKTGITVRRIRVRASDISYTIRPSFVMPYMTGKTDESEKALFLRKFSTPFRALSHVFGKYPMYWQRTEQSVGRNSIVGTTVRNSENMPKNLSADEKHSSRKGEKVYVATTVASECILGVSVAADAGQDSLEKSYGKFRKEARNVCPDYEPETILTDGWQATRNALKNLFPSAVLILCFLHVFIGIRNRAKKKFGDIFREVADRLWNCCKAESKTSFVQRVGRLHEWAEKHAVPPVISEKIGKLRTDIASFRCAYDFPEAHRTGNMLDRLMQRMDHHLFSTQYFHGSENSAETGIRGWALITNFAPSNPYTVKKYEGLRSPVERLNRFRYHDSWLHNLMVSASMGGFRTPPQNPV